MNKNDMDNVEAMFLAETMLREYGLDASLDTLKDMVKEGSITEYECTCVSEILRSLNEQTQA